MFCTNCGNKFPDEYEVCPKCGTIMSSAGGDAGYGMGSGSATPPPDPSPRSSDDRHENRGYNSAASNPGSSNNGYNNSGYGGGMSHMNSAPVSKPVDGRYNYDPISAWGYIGYSLLFAIPLVGLILAIVFAFSGSGSINRRNFARAVCIGWIIGIIFFAIFASIAASVGMHWWREITYYF